MGGMKVGGETPREIFYGSTPVKEVYYGDTKVWPEITAWEPGKYYKPGDVVEYNGGVYRSVRAHASTRLRSPQNPVYWEYLGRA
ncbi:Carbohydrate binding domain protein [Corynebacterium diphtheriae subsp. lausannense]|nr:Carbohydrate binding domain protein [Corynebacterium diphtheriae subsp. lausannense]